MKEYQILILFEDELLFKSENTNKPLLILNYRNDYSNYPIKRMHWRDSLYYEINIYQVMKIRKEKRNNEIERFIVTFLNYLLEDTPDSLITLLKDNLNINREEIANIELEFHEYKINGKRIYSPKKDKNVLEYKI